MAQRDLLIEDRDRVRCLTINRPERANSITRDLAKRLIEAVVDAQSESNVGALMITASGGRTFCAGADLKELSDEASLGRVYTSILPDLYAALVSTEKPTLAALNGTAAGGGMELALACDLRLAAEGARIGLPEIKQGLCPTFGTVALSRLMPQSAALEMLFTGDLVAVEEAARWGLVKVVPAGQLEAAAWDLAGRAAAAAPLVVRKIKALIREGTHLPLLDAMRLQVGPDIYASEDRLEGLRAWREKRPPVWRAR